MGFLQRIRGWFQRWKPAAPYPLDSRMPPLREFIYLDEVSLRSLLSSQTGEVTEGTSQAIADGMTAEISSKMGIPPAMGTAELASRFQTSNSSTLQTSRKASVQSWFREFHAIKGLRLIEPVDGINPVSDMAALKRISDRSILLPVSDLVRGSLVEFRVRLNADPVFRLGALMSEFSGMADDYPELFMANVSPTDFRQAQLVNKVINRLLAGLIPIRATVVDYEVVELDGNQHLVHRDAVANLTLAATRLEIVGVTEHLAYWKDIRRVLFSDAEFTVLCRVSRSGLHSSWTPVKLADVFRDVAPGLADQISDAGRMRLTQTVSVSDTSENRLAGALRLYVALREKEVSKPVLNELSAQVEVEIARLSVESVSATDQRGAFRMLEQLLAKLTAVEVDADRAIALRDQARETSGLPLFPSLVHKPATAFGPIEERPADEASLLDVDVIAIYW